MTLKKLVMCATVALSALVLAGTAFAADTVGTVDTQQVMFQHPQFQDVQRQVRDVTDKLQKEAQDAIDKESDDRKKAEIYQTKRQELAQEERKLMEPIFKEINLAMRTVANQRKLTVIMDKSVVFYGGTDITDAVITELKKGAK